MNTTALLVSGLELLGKSFAVLACAGLLSLGLRRTSAAVRHAVWLAAIAVLLLLPVTKTIAPRWSWRPPAAPPVKVEVRSIPVERVEMAKAATMAAPLRAVRWRFPSGGELVIGTWAIGTALLLGYRLVGSAQLFLLRRRSAPLADARVTARARAVEAQMRLGRRVELRVSNHGCVPATWGIWRPVLLLSPDAAKWSETQLDSALQHEFGHIARRDYLTRWLAHVACALYWPNPLVWLAARSLRETQEQACDDLVLHAGTAADDYAALLFKVARSLQRPRVFATTAVAMARPSTLEGRMLAIIDEKRDRRPLGWLGVTWGALGGALAVAVCAAAQVLAADSPAAASPAGQQVIIEAKFVEIPREATGIDVSAMKSLKAGAAGIAGTFPDDQFKQMLKELHAGKGVDFLAAPRVVTRSGQRAVIEIVREFRYGADWAKEADNWKSKKSATKNVGVTLEVQPLVKPDKTMVIDLVWSIVELLGYRDVETGAEILPPELKEDATLADRLDVTKLAPPANRPVNPAFAERRTSESIPIVSGSTVVLANMQRNDGRFSFPRRDDGRQLILFVTARVAEAADLATPRESAPAAEDAAAPKSAVPAVESPTTTLSPQQKEQLTRMLEAHRSVSAAGANCRECHRDLRKTEQAPAIERSFESHRNLQAGVSCFACHADPKAAK